jgi:A/G-specific adenine glycosylase
MSELLMVRPVRSAAAPEPAALRRVLLGWYRRARRDLPWRRTRDPYRIWVSEVMLQQTQVATAVPFYQRFISRFPNLEALARARGDAVLASWAGLGYYRRARSLHEAARTVVREHAGRIPEEPDAFGRLPGVGRYTTGAVLSMGFDKPLAVLDGNVARVLSRVFALEAAVRDPRGARTLWALADSLVPRRGAGDWNQALMELGATVCTPRNPECARCPVRRLCRARQEGRVHLLPPVPERRRPAVVRRAVVVIERGGRWLMTPRDGNLLGGLWEPPGVDVSGNTDATRRALRRVLSSLGVRARIDPTGQRARHTLSHRDFRVDLWRGVTIGALPRSAKLRLIDPGSPARPVTGLVPRAAKALGVARP